MSFFGRIFGNKAGRWASPSLKPAPHSVSPASPGWQSVGTISVSMPTLPAPNPSIDWPNLRLNPVLQRQPRPSAAPGVLCRSRANPAHLHNDEALQCGLGLKRLGKKYALSFGEAHRRLCAAREEWGARRVGRGGEQPPARSPRTTQLCRLLSLCPAGPAEKGLPRALKQQEVRF